MNDFNLFDFFQNLFEDEFLSKAFILSILTGAVTAIIIYGKGFVSFIYSRIKRELVFTVRIEQTDELFWIFEKWLYSHHRKKYRNVIAYILNRGNDCPKDEIQVEAENMEGSLKDTVKFRQNEDFIIIRYQGSWISIRKGREKLENANNLTSLFFDSFFLTTLFTTKKIRMLLDTIMEFERQMRIKQLINYSYIFDGYNYWYKHGVINGKDLGNIFLPGEDKQYVVSDINRFLTSKEWHLKRGIPYKRGYLFYGPPGNGKTSFAVAIAKSVKRDIYLLNLASVDSDKALINAFRTLPANAVLLIEDIDVMVKSSRNMKTKLSFSTVLNCLDGAFYREGIIMILTTNYIEALDPALIRDGRIDIQLHIENPTSIVMKEYINSFYEQKIAWNGEALSKISVSKLQNICLESDAETIKNKLIALK